MKKKTFSQYITEAEVLNEVAIDLDRTESMIRKDSFNTDKYIRKLVSEVDNIKRQVSNINNYTPIDGNLELTVPTKNLALVAYFAHDLFDGNDERWTISRAGGRLGDNGVTIRVYKRTYR